MNSDFNGQSRDEELSIMFSEAMDWQSVTTSNSEEVIVYPVNGGHRTGSSQVKVKNIVDSSWEKTFHWGSLVANHFKGQYFAYALTVPGKPAGMVRVILSGSSDRIILKGFRGFVRDLSFAFHEKRILVAAVDEYGYLLVHEIVGPAAHLVLQVNPDGITTSSEYHRVVWCPYVPEIPRSFDGHGSDSDDHGLMLACSHDTVIEIWHLGLVNGSISYQTVVSGTTLISDFQGPVVDISFSPDSTAVAAASLDGYIRFFLVNTEKKPAGMLHKWQPHEGKKLSGICFLDDLSPPITSGPLWKWAVTSAENNTEFKLWSCENWECHQTIRFKSTDSTPIVQKMAVDLSATFVLISDIHRKVLYVMHIELEGAISKVSSITQILLPFSAISLAIREATLKVAASSQPDDFEGIGGDDGGKVNRVTMKMLVVQPKSLQKCKAVFELGTSAALGEGMAGTSFSTINTTSEYEAANVIKSSANNNQHFNLLTPDAFVSPAKGTAASTGATTTTTPGSMPLPPPTPDEMLALSSPRRVSPERMTTPIAMKRNGNGHGMGIQSGNSSPSREVEEILCTKTVSMEQLSDGGSSSVATVPKGPSALQDALTAYPPSLSPAFVTRSAESPSVDKYNNVTPTTDPSLMTTAAAAAPTHPTAYSNSSDINGSLLELFQEVLVKPVQNSTQQQMAAAAAPSTPVVIQSWPTVLPNHIIQQQQQRSAPSSVTETTSIQLQSMQQSMNQLIELMKAQKAEQQKMRDEINQLRTELGQSTSSRNAAGVKATADIIPQLESTLNGHFERQQKKLDEINNPAKTQQTVSKLQATIRTELENKTHTLEQRSVDFIRKELQSVIATEMKQVEPVLKNATMQLLSQLSQSKSIVDAYTQATSTAAMTAMRAACKEAMQQQLLPSLDRSFQGLFSQLHATFSKGIEEFVRNIEGHLERQRRLQDRESTAQLTATLDKMRVVLEQVRDSISTDTKTELRKVTSEFPERVRCLLAPMIQAEMQNVAKDQKVALDGALLAVQQVAQATSRAVTPTVAPNPQLVLQNQLKQMIEERRYSEAFQRALSVADLGMVLYVCSRVDAQSLFSAVPCPLPQAVLLSLIQQLSADLTSSTDIKLEYLQEAIMVSMNAIQCRDPTAVEHAPRVLNIVARQLQAFQAANPTGPYSRQVRVLLLSTQSAMMKG